MSFSSTVAQESPKDLGKKVFEIFQNRDYVTLSKMTPKAREILDLHKKYDPEKLSDEKEFKKRYITRDSLFIEKCILMMFGKTGIDFRSATLDEVTFISRLRGKRSFGETLDINYLKIYFVFENKKYNLQFEGIRKIGNIWKLGERVEIKSVDE